MNGDQSDQPIYHAATTKLGLLYSQKPAEKAQAQMVGEFKKEHGLK